MAGIGNTESRFSILGQAPHRILLPPALALLVLATLLYFLGESGRKGIPRDGDYCPMDRDAITGSAVFLFDFTKPLDAAQATLPGDLLRDLTLNLGRDTELRVFTLTNSPGAPRARLQRLCKPFDNADLEFEAAENPAGATRDCDDLAAGIPDDIRRSATGFCASRDALQGDLNARAGGAWPKDENVANAYLVEAFEDIRLEFAERPDPHLLYVFSDMMQHAPWYSHLDLQWLDWNYDEFDKLLESRNWSFRQPLDSAAMRVEIFYVPRAETTAAPRVKEKHQQFWRQYFNRAQIAFNEQPAMSTYTAVPLMNVLTESEIAARQRAAIEQLLLEIKQEQQALEREQRELQIERARQAEAQQRRLAERQRELDRARQAEAERQRAEREAQARRDQERLLERQAAAAAAAALQAETPTQQTAAAELPPCSLRVSADAGAFAPDYPRRGRMDFGNAKIAVRYLVGESGETVDEQVTVVPERSSADQVRYFNLFARAALEKVRSWVFSFSEPDDQACRKRQTRTTSFEFNYG